MGVEKKKFSVIVPVYNVENYLAQCLDSLLNQTYDGLEIIVVDDVSTDSSREIARDYAHRYPEKVRLIEHSINTRQGGARNTGMDAATGDYLMFLDSDDYLKPDTLERLCAAFNAQDADIVEFSYEYVDEAGNYLSSGASFEAFVKVLQGEVKPLLISAMGPCSKAYRAELFQKTRIRFPEKLYYEDFCTVPKVLLQARKVVYLEDPLYCYRQRTGSTVHDTNLSRNRDILVVMEELESYFRAQQVSRERWLELEYLAIRHVLYYATLRVNSIDPGSSLQKEMKDFVDSHFPDHRSNPYRRLFSSREQRLLGMIEKERYSLVYLFWHCRNRVSGAVKTFLRKAGGERVLRRIG